MKKNNAYSNNTPHNIDYSPFVPTDTLNTSVSPAVGAALAGSAVAFGRSGPTVGVNALAVSLTSALTGDAIRGEHSFSASITGHDGDTYGHIHFP